MALQFDPSPYLEAFKYGRNIQNQNAMAPLKSASQLGDTLGQVGSELAQIPEQQRQQRMQQLQAAITAKNNGMNPDATANWLNTGRFPSSQPTDSASPAAPPMQSPSPSPMFGQASSGGSPFSESDQTGGPSIPSQTPAASPVIDAWNKHPDRTQFAPKSSKAPSGTPTSGFGALFKSPNVDYGKIVSSMDQGDYSGYQSLNEKQRGDVEKIREYNSNKSDRQLKDKELQDYRRQSLGMQQNKLDATVGTRENQFDQRDLTRLTNQLNSDHDLTNARQKINNVDTAMRNLEQVRSQPGGADQRQMVEIAATTMRVLKNSGQITEGELNQLIPQTYKGNFDKFLEKLTNTPQSIEAQDFVDRFSHTLQREKGQAQSQLEMGFNRTTSLHGDVLDKYPDKAKQLYSSWGVNHPTYNPQQSAPSQGGAQGAPMKIGRFNVTVH